MLRIIVHLFVQAPVWMTARFLMEICTLFYENLNARQVRRQLAATYSANALAEQLRQSRSDTAPYSLSWALTALPKSRQLRPLILKVFASFVVASARIMRRRQIAYNAQGLRHDGNYGLAKILATKVDGARCSVVLAVCGTDGSLLDVPVPLPTEGFQHVRGVLEPLLREIQAVRMECGFGYEGSIPVFHAIDVYEKHATFMRNLYGRVWDSLRISAAADTPKGSASRRTLLPSKFVEDFCTICGDP